MKEFSILGCNVQAELYPATIKLLSISEVNETSATFEGEEIKGKSILLMFVPANDPKKVAVGGRALTPRIGQVSRGASRLLFANQSPLNFEGLEQLLEMCENSGIPKNDKDSFSLVGDLTQLDKTIQDEGLGSVNEWIYMPKTKVVLTLDRPFLLTRKDDKGVEKVIKNAEGIPSQFTSRVLYLFDDEAEDSLEARIKSELKRLKWADQASVPAE